MDAATLDRYEQAFMTISRGESKARFIAKVVDAQISFITAKSGSAESLVLHQHGHDVPMKRINATEAQRIEDLAPEKIKSHRDAASHELSAARISSDRRADAAELRRLQ